MIDLDNFSRTIRNNLNSEVGKTYEGLKILGFEEPIKTNRGYLVHIAVCECLFCGNQKNIRLTNLMNGQQSCGCEKGNLISKNRSVHGMVGTRIYKIWDGMKERCSNPNHISYARYGGRGIKVCKEWVKSFPSFYEYVGDPPSNTHSIDRFPNNDGDYEPGNVRWATPKEQAANRRRRYH